MPKRLLGRNLSGYVHGSVLKDLREARGLKAIVVAKRAGYRQQHYSKIEDKESVTVEEFERITKAMDLRPGDLLENSIEEVKPLLPLVAELQRFSPRAHERVREMLRAAALMLEENLIGDVAHQRSVSAAYTPPSNQSTHSEEIADINVPATGPSVGAKPRRSEGSGRAERTAARKRSAERK